MVLAQPCKVTSLPSQHEPQKPLSRAVWGRGPCWSGAPASGPPSLPPRQLGTVSRYLHECEPASTAHCRRGKALTDGARRRFKATRSTKGDGSRLHLNQNLAELPSDSLNLTKLRPSAVTARAPHTATAARGNCGFGPTLTGPAESPVPLKPHRRPDPGPQPVICEEPQEPVRNQQLFSSQEKS